MYILSGVLLVHGGFHPDQSQIGFSYVVAETWTMRLSLSPYLRYKQPRGGGGGGGALPVLIHF